ncbi:hypothetical protein J437_LFUL008233, partial [Ladona fulva]
MSDLTPEEIRRRRLARLAATLSPQNELPTQVAAASENASTSASSSTDSGPSTSRDGQTPTTQASRSGASKKVPIWRAMPRSGLKRGRSECSCSSRHDMSEFSGCSSSAGSSCQLRNGGGDIDNVEVKSSKVCGQLDARCKMVVDAFLQEQERELIMQVVGYVVEKEKETPSRPFLPVTALIPKTFHLLGKDIDSKKLLRIAFYELLIYAAGNLQPSERPVVSKPASTPSSSNNLDQPSTSKSNADESDAE